MNPEPFTLSDFGALPAASDPLDVGTSGQTPKDDDFDALFTQLSEEEPRAWPPLRYIGMYTLDENGNPQPEANTLVWAQWMETANRSLALDEVSLAEGEYMVSTAFMGLDHSFQGSTPILFETMIWRVVPDDGQNHGREWLDYQVRYATKGAALEGHYAAVRGLESGVILAQERASEEERRRFDALLNGGDLDVPN